MFDEAARARPLEHLTEIADNFSARGILIERHGRASQPTTPERQADIQHGHGQMVHTLYVAAHGTAVALGAYVTDLQHGLEVGTRRRHPMAERPTALEITAAQDMLARGAAHRGLRGGASSCVSES